MDCNEITQFIEKYRGINTSLLEIVNNPTPENLLQYSSEELQEYEQELEQYALLRWGLARHIVKVHHFQFNFREKRGRPTHDLGLLPVRVAGDKIVSLSGPNEFSIINPSTGQLIRKISLPRSPWSITTNKVNTITLSESGRYLHVCSDYINTDDNQREVVDVLDLETGQEMPGRANSKHTEFIGDEWMIYGRNIAMLQLETVHGERRSLGDLIGDHLLQIGSELIQNIVANPDGVVAIKTGSHLVVFNALTQELIYLDEFESKILDLVAVPNSQKFLINVGSRMGIDTYWFDYTREKKLQAAFDNRLLTHISVDPAGKVVAAIEFNHELTVRSVESEEIISTVKLPENMGEIDRIQIMAGYKIGVVYKSGRVLIYGKKAKEKPKPLSRRWLGFGKKH